MRYRKNDDTFLQEFQLSLRGCMREVLHVVQHRPPSAEPAPRPKQGATVNQDRRDHRPVRRSEAAHARTIAGSPENNR